MVDGARLSNGKFFPIKQTNADKYFRNATDEEIAKWIHRHDCHTNLYGYDNEEAILEWLKQEVDGDA